MATARHPGTNRSVLTYGPGGGYDYDTDSAETWQDWEDDTTEDMSAATGSSTTHVLQMAAGSYSDFVAVAGGVTDSSHFRISEPTPGDEHDGDPNAGVIMTRDDGTPQIVNISEDYAGMYDLVLDLECNTGTGGANAFQSTANHGKAIAIYVRSATNDNAIGVNNGIRMIGGASNPDYAIDCIVTGVVGGSSQAGRGYLMGTGGRTTYLYNSIAEGNTTNLADSGIDYAGGTATAKNCIAQNNNGADGIEANITQISCYESSGAGSVLFTNAAAGDYTLQDTDTDALGQGTNLDGSAPHNESIFPFEDDIARIDWEVPWSMGVHQFVTAGKGRPIMTGGGMNAGIMTGGGL